MYCKWTLPLSVYFLLMVCLYFWYLVFEIYSAAFHLSPLPALACTVASALGLCTITMYLCFRSS